MKTDVHTEIITYSCGDRTFKGYLAMPKTTQKAPGIIIAHAWMGQDEFARKKAIALAELGYAAFAADLYGDGKTAKTSDEALELMMPLFLDRHLLQQRMIAAYETLKTNPLVDKERIGAIGFCFGGLAAIELFRSGAFVRGVASFHAVLGSKLGNQQATVLPISKEIQGKILILHGHDDPLVSKEDIESIQNELTQAKIDWQMIIYGRTSHAFTNPEAHETSLGLIYNASAEKRSWQSMRNFFEEVFI